MSHIEYDPKVILAKESEREHARVKAKNHIASGTMLAVTTRTAYIMILFKDGSVIEGTVVIPGKMERVNSYAAPTLNQNSFMAVKLSSGSMRRVRVMDIDQAEVL